MQMDCILNANSCLVLASLGSVLGRLKVKLDPDSIEKNLMSFYLDTYVTEEGGGAERLLFLL